MKSLCSICGKDFKGFPFEIKMDGTESFCCPKCYSKLKEQYSKKDSCEKCGLFNDRKCEVLGEIKQVELWGGYEYFVRRSDCQDFVDKGNTKEVSKARIRKFEKVGRYEQAALEYEKIGMLEEAGETRRKAKTTYVISANLNIAKIGSISMECPHCGASQPITSKSNDVTCSYCRKNYVIPKKVLELL